MQQADANHAKSCCQLERAPAQRGSFALAAFAYDAVVDKVVDEDVVDEDAAAAAAVGLPREASNGFVYAGFPNFGRRPPQGPGRLPGVLLTVFEPTWRPTGVLPVSRRVRGVSRVLLELEEI